ncbi:hypothetical protein OROGR_007991 [Orobanche gracilis]
MSAEKMSALPGVLCTVTLPCKKSGLRHSLQVRAQSYKDNKDKSSDNIVDANLHLLRVRIEQVKDKERLERHCCSRVDHTSRVDQTSRIDPRGWDYFASDVVSCNPRREKGLLQFYQLLGIAGGTLGLTILTCTFCLYIISFVVHLN